jgi:hypothetical protein
VSCRRLLPPCTGIYFRISSCFVIQSACSCCRVLSMNCNTEAAYFSRISVDEFAINYSRGDCSVLIICRAGTSSDFYRWLLYNEMYCNGREQDKNGRNLHSGHVTYTDLCTCSYFGHKAHLRAICFFPQTNYSPGLQMVPRFCERPVHPTFHCFCPSVWVDMVSYCE